MRDEYVSLVILATGFLVALLLLSGCSWRLPDCDVYGPYEGTNVQGAEFICYFERDL